MDDFRAADFLTDDVLDLSDEFGDFLIGGEFASAETPQLNTIEAFEDYLLNREYKPEKPYGIFEKGAAVCRFFGSKNSENILEEIRRKNEEQGLGNIKIPNTNITLINYSFCPKCKAVYSFNELIAYYRNPKPDAQYKSMAQQYRNDTRICCTICGTYFLPALIISDGTPKKEVQFLCRLQTISAVERYYLSKDSRVLTKNQNNIMRAGNLTAIKNDVLLKDLEEKPTLITNMLQYTPPDLMMNLIDGTNAEKGDLVFNERKWKVYN